MRENNIKTNEELDNKVFENWSLLDDIEYTYKRDSEGNEYIGESYIHNDIESHRSEYKEYIEGFNDEYYFSDIDRYIGREKKMEGIRAYLLWDK